MRTFLQGNLRAAGSIWRLSPGGGAGPDLPGALQHAWLAGGVHGHRHCLLADTSTPAGKMLAEGVWNGSTRFPAGESRAPHPLLPAPPARDEASLGEALTLAREVLVEAPSQRAVTYAAQAGDATGRATSWKPCSGRLPRATSAGGSCCCDQDGYYRPLVAAYAALGHLQVRAQRRGDSRQRRGRRSAWRSVSATTRPSAVRSCGEVAGRFAGAERRASSQMPDPSSTKIASPSQLPPQPVLPSCGTKWVPSFS